SYLALLLRLGEKLSVSSALLPRIYCVNWFRKGPDREFVWPGLGGNMRMLKWMLGRLYNQAQRRDHVFGISPRYEDLDWQGLYFSADRFEQVMASDSSAWREELALHDELFARLASRLPAELSRIRDDWTGRL